MYQHFSTSLAAVVAGTVMESHGTPEQLVNMIRPNMYREAAYAIRSDCQKGHAVMSVNDNYPCGGPVCATCAKMSTTLELLADRAQYDIYSEQNPEG